MTTAAHHRIHGTRVLLVSDDSPLSKRLETLLLEHQFVVDVERDSDTALERLTARRYELLWLDMGEALSSDFALLKTIGERNLRTVALIADSGTSDELAVNTALSYGAQDILLSTDSDLEFYQASENAMNIVRVKHRQTPVEGASDGMREFFIEHAKDMIFALDSRGAFTYINAKASEVLGYSPQSLVGKAFSSIVHPRDTEKFETALKLVDAKKRSGELQLNLLHADNDSRSERKFFDIALRSFSEVPALLAGVPGDHAYFASARDTTDQRRVDQQIMEKAFRDPVTGLPNRSLFINRLQQDLALAKREAFNLAVLFIDINGLQQVNDTHGRTLGDKLLAAISERLKATLRTTDTIARFGGDEFTVILNDMESEDRTRKVGEKLVNAMRRPFKIGGTSVSASIAIGFSTFPETAANGQELLDQADEAMYIAKRDPTNNVAGYSVQAEAVHINTLPGHRDLLEMINSGTFSVRYSPVVGVRKRLMHSIEAKAHFHTPALSGLSPTQFSSLIESQELGSEWFLSTLTKICGDIAGIDAALTAGGLRIGLEAPLSMLQQENFANAIIDCIDQHNVDGSRFELIVQEAALEGERKSIKAQLKALGEAGFTICIRNFGSGNASLHNLGHINIAAIRLSRQLTSYRTPNAPEKVVARAISAMTNALNIELIAEEIETLQQLHCAADLECTGAQGIILSNDLDIDELTARLQSQVRSSGGGLKVVQNT